MVGSYQSVGLPEFFAQMARDWRGWVDTREWEAFEGELRLSATMDRTGHISLVVELENGFGLKWTAKAILVLEAGQLDRLAAEAAEFETASIRLDYPHDAAT